jgi:hypothetical protein
MQRIRRQISADWTGLEKLLKSAEKIAERPEVGKAFHNSDL